MSLSKKSLLFFSIVLFSRLSQGANLPYLAPLATMVEDNGDQFIPTATVATIPMAQTLRVRSVRRNPTRTRNRFRHATRSGRRNAHPEGVVVEGVRIISLEEFKKFIEEGDLEKFKNHCEQFPLDEQDLRGNTFLHLAVSYQKEKIVKFLLERGASTSLRTFGPHGETAFQKAKNFCLSSIVTLFRVHFRKKRVSEERFRRYQEERRELYNYAKKSPEKLKTEVLPRVVH